MVKDVIYTDNVNIEPEHEHEHSRVRWGAVIAGLLIAMVSQVLLGLFGLAIGLSTLNPATNTNLGGFGIGSGIWLIISTIISVFLGSWAASWWSSTHHRDNGALHGVLTWSLFLVVTMFLLGSGIGSILGGAFNLVASNLNAATQGLAIGAATKGPAAVEQQVTNVANTAAIQSQLTQQLNQYPNPSAVSSLNRSSTLKGQISQRIAAGDDQGAAAMISRNSGLNQSQAMDVVRSTSVSQREASQQVTNPVRQREVAQQVTKTASRVAWWTFMALLLSLIAAAAGGYLGTQPPDHGRRSSTRSV